ncbi:MAG: Arm DNA-binding domain-containing protein [Barnesiella sp.]
MNISINAVFRKDRLNNQNAAPVHLRLTQNRKLKHISTGVTLNINEWDFEINVLRVKLPNCRRYNSASTPKSTNSAAKSNVLKR